MQQLIWFDLFKSPALTAGFCPYWQNGRSKFAEGGKAIMKSWHWKQVSAIGYTCHMSWRMSQMTQFNINIYIYIYIYILDIFVSSFGQRGKTICWMVWYQQGLPLFYCLIFIMKKNCTSGSLPLLETSFWAWCNPLAGV